VWGETRTISLDPVFTPEQVASLRKAAEKSRGKAATPAWTYILSGRVFSPCGKHYVGFGKLSANTRNYRCSGKVEAYPGAPVCDCSQLNADAVEGWAWGEVSRLLGDAERLKALTEGWVGKIAGKHIDHVGRLTDLDRQIAEQDETLAVATAVAARQAARRGLTGRVAEAAVEKTLRPIQGEIDELGKLRSEALAWQAEAEQAVKQARDLRALAEVDHCLDNLVPEQRADFLGALTIRITVTGPVPSARKGVACPVGEWFREKERAVPDFSEELWREVKDLVPVTRGLSPRVMLEAFLAKARSGASWPVMEEQFGSSRLRLHWRRWKASGLWDQIMHRLKGYDGCPPAEPVRLPPMRMEGDVRPGVILAASEPHYEASGPWGPACSSSGRPARAAGR
jgi:hypothetical protein